MTLFPPLLFFFLGLIRCRLRALRTRPRHGGFAKDSRKCHGTSFSPPFFPLSSQRRRDVRMGFEGRSRRVRRERGPENAASFPPSPSPRQAASAESAPKTGHRSTPEERKAPGQLPPPPFLFSQHGPRSRTLRGRSGSRKEEINEAFWQACHFSPLFPLPVRSAVVSL